MKSEPAPSEQTRHYPNKSNWRGGFIVLLAACLVARVAWTQVQHANNLHSGTTLFFGSIVLSPDKAAVWCWLAAGFYCLLLLFFITALLLLLLNSRKPSFVELHPDALLITTGFKKRLVRLPLADIGQISEATESGIPRIHLVTIHRKHFFFSSASFHDPSHYTEIREFLSAHTLKV